MEHRAFSALTIAVLSVVALLLAMYGLAPMLMLIAGYLPD